MNTKPQQISYSRQWVIQKDVDEVIKVLKTDNLTQGLAVPKFEKAVSDYCGVTYAVAYSSGTAALHAACFAAGLSFGAEVITTPLTFAASANCILYVGATPVFVDIRKNLPLIDPQEIERKINPKTRAIIPVDYSGLPADYDEINLLAKKYKLIVIADAAHSFGAMYKEKKVGTLADMTIFSFHPVKTITTGEGGMVVTDNKKYYQRLLMFRTHGITKDKTLFVSSTEGPWFYEMQELGFNYRLTEIQAALGISQMNRINSFIKRRRDIAQKYQQAFAAFNYIQVLPEFVDRISAWHLFPILLKTNNIEKDRKELFIKMHKAGIKVQVHYIPVHLHPYYQKRFGYKKGDFPNSEEYYDGEISLPIYPKMFKSDIHRVITTTTKLLESL